MQDLPSKDRRAMTIILTTVFAVSFVISILADIFYNWLLLGVFKMLVVPSISQLLLVNWNGSYNVRFLVLQGALLFAWLGDFFLWLSSYGEAFFMIGGVSFFLQQLIYIYLNVSTMEKGNCFFYIPYWGLPFLGYLAVIPLSLNLNTPVLYKILGLVYLLAVASGYFTSFFVSTKNKVKFWCGVVGFAFFTGSDMLVITDAFDHELSRLLNGTILFTYYIAQALIGYSYLPDKERTKYIS